MKYIYNSRNYRSILAIKKNRKIKKIYNSRNYRSILANNKKYNKIH